MAKQVSIIIKSVKEYSGVLTNSAIVLGTAGVEQITTVAIYRCPCVEPSSLGAGCDSPNATSYNPTCTQQLNYGYGLAYLIAPAFALLIFTFAANPKLWKSITGCIGKSSEYRRKTPDASLTLIATFCQSLISPATWVCIALIDGRYLACSVTTLPYDLGREGSTYTTCEAVAAAKTIIVSNEFQNSRTFSQVIGAICITCVLFAGFSVYCITQCTFPLTYYHAKYYQVYRQMEQSEFEDEMTKKAQKEAEENVQKFLKERREKSLWDRISTVFQFHRDQKELALYSQLYEWVQECDHEHDTPVHSDVEGAWLHKEEERHSASNV